MATKIEEVIAELGVGPNEVAILRLAAGAADPDAFLQELYVLAKNDPAAVVGEEASALLSADSATLAKKGASTLLQAAIGKLQASSNFHKAVQRNQTRLENENNLDKPLDRAEFLIWFNSLDDDARMKILADDAEQMLFTPRRPMLKEMEKKLASRKEKEEKAALETDGTPSAAASSKEARKTAKFYQGLLNKSAAERQKKLENESINPEAIRLLNPRDRLDILNDFADIERDKLESFMSDPGSVPLGGAKVLKNPGPADGPLKVVGLLGTGGYAKTYRVVDSAGKEWAAKTPLNTIDARAAFANEIDIYKKLQKHGYCKNFVQFHRDEKNDSDLFKIKKGSDKGDKDIGDLEAVEDIEEETVLDVMITDLVDGPDLDFYLPFLGTDIHFGQLDNVRFGIAYQDVGKSIYNVLTYFKEAEIEHRDLHGLNVKVSAATGEIKVFDMGGGRNMRPYPWWPSYFTPFNGFFQGDVRDFYDLLKRYKPNSGKGSFNDFLSFQNAFSEEIDADPSRWEWLLDSTDDEIAAKTHKEVVVREKVKRDGGEAEIVEMVFASGLANEDCDLLKNIDSLDIADLIADDAVAGVIDERLNKISGFEDQHRPIDKDHPQRRLYEEAVAAIVKRTMVLLARIQFTKDTRALLEEVAANQTPNNDEAIGDLAEKFLQMLSIRQDRRTLAHEPLSDPNFAFCKRVVELMVKKVSMPDGAEATVDEPVIDAEIEETPLDASDLDVKEAIESALTPLATLVAQVKTLVEQPKPTIAACEKAADDEIKKVFPASEFTAEMMDAEGNKTKKFIPRREFSSIDPGAVELCYLEVATRLAKAEAEAENLKNFDAISAYVKTLEGLAKSGLTPDTLEKDVTKTQLQEAEKRLQDLGRLKKLEEEHAKATPPLKQIQDAQLKTQGEKLLKILKQDLSRLGRLTEYVAELQTKQNALQKRTTVGDSIKEKGKKVVNAISLKRSGDSSKGDVIADDLQGLKKQWKALQDLRRNIEQGDKLRYETYRELAETVAANLKEAEPLKSAKLNPHEVYAELLKHPDSAERQQALDDLSKTFPNTIQALNLPKEWPKLEADVVMAASQQGWRPPDDKKAARTEAAKINKLLNDRQLSQRPVPPEGYDFQPGMFLGTLTNGSSRWAVANQFGRDPTILRVSKEEGPPTKGLKAGDTKRFTIRNPELAEAHEKKKSIASGITKTFKKIT